MLQSPKSCSEIALMPEQNILLVQLRQLGDILLTTPCIREVRRLVPGARITFLSHKMGNLILAKNPDIDELIFYDDSQSAVESLRFAWSLRRRHFAEIYDFMGNPRSALYSLLSGAPKRLAFASARNVCYTQTIRKGETDQYLVREKFRLLAAGGIAASQVGLVLPWDQNDLQPFFGFLDAAPQFRAASLRVALSPTHRRENRKWPVARYAELADWLVKSWGASVLWLWGPNGELDEVMAIRRLCKEHTEVAPPTKFAEMAGLIANCDLFIGNSNGPSHVAVAVDTCSFQLHGHTNLRTWCPLTAKHRGIQSSEFGMEGASLAPITVPMVQKALDEFRPEILNHAEKRRQLGVKFGWDQP
jgi:ADP-heptose:LPS heptosyltransferase